MEKSFEDLTTCQVDFVLGLQERPRCEDASVNQKYWPHNPKIQKLLMYRLFYIHFRLSPSSVQPLCSEMKAPAGLTRPTFVLICPLINN